MKTPLKRLTLYIALFCIIFGIIIPPQKADLSTFSAVFNKNYAVFASEEQWARIINENTPFYADYSCKIVKFYLPKTYFVKVVTAGEDATRVIYMDGNDNLPFREGYIKTCDLLLFDGIPQSPYPEISIKITADEILFADSDKQYPKTVLSAGQTAVYYGLLATGSELFYYVYADGYIGYVRKSAFAPFEVPDHPLPLVTQKPDSEPNSAPQDTEIDDTDVKSAFAVDSTMKIIITIAVILVCISVIYLLFRPRYTVQPKMVAYKEEDDFY